MFLTDYAPSLSIIGLNASINSKKALGFSLGKSLLNVGFLLFIIHLLSSLSIECVLRIMASAYWIAPLQSAVCVAGLNSAPLSSLMAPSKRAFSKNLASSGFLKPSSEILKKHFFYYKLFL